MGSFRDIVRSRRGPSGRIDRFALGFEIPPSESGIPRHEFRVTFAEQGSEPTALSHRYRFDDGSFFELSRGEADKTVLSIAGHKATIPFSFDRAMILPEFLTAPSRLDKADWGPGAKPILDFIDRISNAEARQSQSPRRSLFDFWDPNLSPLIPVAPLRAKPKRTYDPVRETATPEGEHIPMLMMRLDRSDKRHWQSLHDNLISFGSNSGLFSDIKVKRHGKQMSDPFQIQVKVRSGSHANLMDVGYGISQSLPILVDVLAADQTGPARRRGTDKEARTLMLQQPEVHLHPRGQAELATLFVESVRKRNSRFLIETHSDYIVDRIRYSVRKGLLKADDVSLLYFEPRKNSVKIHTIELDGDGNVTNAPNGYRDFFLKETDRVLGFED